MKVTTSAMPMNPATRLWVRNCSPSVALISELESSRIGNGSWICRQDAGEFAQGTSIEALADRIGALVLMPRQKRTANPYRCWNWFDRRTADGKGEAAIVAAMIRKVLRRYGADPARVVAVGNDVDGAAAGIVVSQAMPISRTILQRT